MIKATLVNKNTEVIRFTAKESIDGKIPKLTITSAQLLNQNLAPISVNNEKKLTQQLQIWFDKRYLNQHRLTQLQTLQNAFAPLKDRIHFSNFTDQYFVKYDNENYEEVSALTCLYNRGKGKVRIFDVFSCKDIMYSSNLDIGWDDPDLCTNGIMKKTWEIDENGILSLNKFSEFGHDVYNEVIASKILQRMNKKNCIVYSPIISHYLIGNSCERMVTADEELVPAWQLLQSIDQKKHPTVYQALLAAIDKYEIPGAIEHLDEIIKIDAIIANSDRNTGNICFIRDVNTGKFVGPSKIFDFSAAFTKNPVGKSRCMLRDREEYLYSKGEIIAFNPRSYDFMIDKANFSSEETRACVVKTMSEIQEEIKRRNREFQRKGGQDVGIIDFIA